MSDLGLGARLDGCLDSTKVGIEEANAGRVPAQSVFDIPVSRSGRTTGRTEEETVAQEDGAVL